MNWWGLGSGPEECMESSHNFGKKNEMWKVSLLKIVYDQNYLEADKKISKCKMCQSSLQMTKGIFKIV